MTESQAQQLLDKIIGQIFGYKNPLSLEQFRQKFAFDVRIPQQVIDNIDGSVTWAQSTNPLKYMKMDNARGLEIAGASRETDFLRPKRPLNSIEDMMAAWEEINYTTTERVSDSLNVAQSDNVEFSENVFRSQDIRASKNILFCDGLGGSEYMAACQRSRDSTFCIRLDDSGECTNCFGVAWSGRLTNCFMMHDAGDMQDSMFCTNISGKQYCIANMQYTKEEYMKFKDIVMRWLLTS
jgi:hypothetical protein